MRTCSSRGSPTTTLASAALIACAAASACAAGTIALRIAVHFCPAFAVISRTTSRTNASNSGWPGAASRPEHAGVDRIGLADEAHRVRDDRRMRAQLLRRARRTRERHDVLARQMIEQIAEAAADQLQRALRQDAGLDDAPDHQLGEIGSRGRRLHDRRHAGQQRRRQLLEHAPDREVERVDVDRRAFQRHADVLADERAGLRQHLRRRHRRTRDCSATRARRATAYANSVPKPPSMSIQESALVAPVAYDSV